MAIIKKKAAQGAIIKNKTKISNKYDSKILPSGGKQKPSDFAPKSYDIRFKPVPGGGDNYDETIKREKENKKNGMMKMGGAMKKAKNGFDLNKDGKTTFKDVLIGRGVLPKTAKSGASMKKCKNGCK